MRHWYTKGLFSVGRHIHHGWWVYWCYHCRGVIYLLSMGRKWWDNGTFHRTCPMKKTDAESIHSAFVECLNSKNISLSKLIGMGFDGAATFSGKRTGVQERMKEHAPHAIFVHCHCHQLQLACVQATNATKALITSTWHSLLYGNSSTSLQSVHNHSRRSRNFLTCQS